MPRTYRRKKYGKKYWRTYRYGKKRYHYKSSRYINGTGRSSIRLKVMVQDPSQQKQSGNYQGYGNVYAIYPYWTQSNGVTASPLYQKYVELYEETKFIGMKVQVCVTSVIGNATLPSLQIFTAWDRRHGSSEPAKTADEIVAQSTNSVMTALNNNVAKFTKSIYASDLIEKAQWHDSDLNSSGADLAWTSAGSNPNFFCPAFYMCFGSPSITTSQVVNFSVSTTYYVAFRSPRYSASASKSLPVKTVLALEPDTKRTRFELDDAGEASMAEDDSDFLSSDVHDSETWQEWLVKKGMGAITAAGVAALLAGGGPPQVG